MYFFLDSDTSDAYECLIDSLKLYQKNLVGQNFDEGKQYNPFDMQYLSMLDFFVKTL